MKTLPLWFLLLCSILLSVSCKNKSYKQGSLKIGDEIFDIGVPNSRFFSCLLGSKDSTYKADQTTWLGKNDCNGLVVVRRLVNAEAHGWYENQLLLEPDSGVIWAIRVYKEAKEELSGFPSIVHDDNIVDSQVTIPRFGILFHQSTFFLNNETRHLDTCFFGLFLPPNAGDLIFR
ncbi:MAG: hypothetical protein IPP17_22960 [Bacteroidetes bacterium]|nr:hypothetical protein [Bacteroidota bacterium]